VAKASRARDRLDADRLVDGVRGQRHHGAQGLRIGGCIVERDRAAVAVADQHAIFDAEVGQQARQDVVRLDLHVAQAGIGGRRDRSVGRKALSIHSLRLSDSSLHRRCVGYPIGLRHLTAI
jgi:hypothetical protein